MTATRRTSATLSGHAATPATNDWNVGTLGASVSAGDVVIGFVFTDQSTAVITANSIKDDLNGTGVWAKLLGFNVTVNGFPCEASMWSVVCASGGSVANVTITFSGHPGSQGLGATFGAYVPGASQSFPSGASAIDTSHNAVAASGTSLSSGATGTTTAANELGLGFYADTGETNTLTAGSGWTLLTANANGDSSTGFEDMLDTGASGSTITATGTRGGNAGAEMMAAVYMLTTTGGGGGGLPFFMQEENLMVGGLGRLSGNFQ